MLSPDVFSECLLYMLSPITCPDTELRPALESDRRPSTEEGAATTMRPPVSTRRRSHPVLATPLRLALALSPYPLPSFASGVPSPSSMMYPRSRRLGQCSCECRG